MRRAVAAAAFRAAVRPAAAGALAPRAALPQQPSRPQPLAWQMRFASKSGLSGVEHITYVKKIKMDGTPCKKCGEVTERLEKADQMKMIDEVLIADERDDQSPGMLLAKQYDLNRAPFFIVKRSDGTAQAYTVYFDFVKKVLKGKADETQGLKDTMEQNKDVLDMI
eukprot:TRINITY_DN60640_c0_g1_i1.p1 TRINITY_DN60640_c0_g1~~TRINITY_DN60640_c0_g1_i1.p1  ORF type:complete len:194 (+),score=96.94 TRINITY_DN60640_c0_g1_i1:87-584(+)